MKLVFVLSLIALCTAYVAPKQNFVECEACRLTLTSLNKYVRESKHWEFAIKFFKQLCLKSEGQNYALICEQVTDEFQDIVIDAVVDRILNPEFLCVELEYCSSPHYVPENFTAYEEKIMKGKPPGPGPQPSGDKTFRFVHITDVHLDKYYTTGSTDNCGIPQCCRTGNGTVGNWGGHICDLPLRTLEAALQQIKALEPEFVMVTGDFPPHDIWNQSKSYNLEYQAMVSKAFRDAFPNTPIYVIFGNHACFPINQCPFGTDYWLPKPFTQYWGLNDLILLSLQTHAGYSVKHKLTNLRIIALDTNVFNAGDVYIANNNTNLMGQLDWIYSELLAAEKNKEQVYIMGHMPTGDVNALPEWAKHFNVLVDRFEYTIAGLFFGHSHDDEIHIHRGVYTNLPTKVQWVAPSFTTYSNLNPSFRFFEVDNDSKVILDFQQYRLNLTKANLTPDVLPIWDVAYNFKEFYGLSDLSPSSVYELALLMGDNEQLSLQYLNNFYSGGIDSPKKCDHSCQHFNMCRMTYANYDSIFKCQGPTESGFIYQLYDVLFEKWSYKVK